jgi:hypothetical protein
LHAVGLSNEHKRSGHPHTANASASDFAHSTELNLGGHFATLRPCHSRVCRDIDVRESKVGYSSSRSRLLTGPASCLSNISIACGRLIVRLHRTCRSKQTPSASCRTISMPFGHCLPAMPISRHAGAKSKAAFPRATSGAIEIEEPSTEARNGYLAAAVLGARNPRRRGLRTSRRLHPLQFGEAPTCRSGLRLAVQQFPPLCEGRFVTGRLGRRRGRDPGPLRRIIDPSGRRVRKIAVRPYRILLPRGRFCASYGGVR